MALLGAALLFGQGLSPAHAATCADHGTQAGAQRAADTRDADGDGVYCESLPCPCSRATGRDGGRGGGGAPAPAQPRRACVATSRVQNISFSSTKFPNIRRHYLGALSRGWPRVLVVNRTGADIRRARLLEGYPTRPGMDRDEYPPAVGRGRANGTQKGLVRGINPIGWRADGMYVPSTENRSHGSALGTQLRGLCNGVRFRYVFAG
jgi:hypothetical protein